MLQLSPCLYVARMTMTTKQKTRPSSATLHPSTNKIVKQMNILNSRSHCQVYIINSYLSKRLYYIKLLPPWSFYSTGLRLNTYVFLGRLYAAKDVSKNRNTTTTKFHLIGKKGEKYVNFVVPLKKLYRKEVRIEPLCHVQSGDKVDENKNVYVYRVYHKQ